MSFNRKEPNRTSARAFSLVEIMIVIVIIGLLAGVVTVNVRRYLIKAKQTVARQEISQIAEAVDMFWSEAGRYPTSDEGLSLLVSGTDQDPEPLLTGGEAALIDPWGNPYQYNSPGSGGESYEIICTGSDGREGGTGEAADISSVDLKNQ